MSRGGQLYARGSVPRIDLVPLAPFIALRNECNGAAKTDMKKALITGVTGQDGSYLAELLLEKGYEVQIGRASCRERV